LPSESPMDIGPRMSEDTMSADLHGIHELSELILSNSFLKYPSVMSS